MNENWFYLDGQERKGPFDIGALRQLLKAGVIRPDTWVAKEGDPDWKPAQTLLEEPQGCEIFPNQDSSSNQTEKPKIKRKTYRAEISTAVIGILVVGAVWMVMSSNSKTKTTGAPPQTNTPPQTSTQLLSNKDDKPDSTASKPDSIAQSKTFEEIKKLLLDANTGNSQSQFELATIYIDGAVGITPNIYTAVDWLEKAAEQGHLDAQLAIAKIYAEGKKVSQNFELAHKWYRKAAEQGSPEAQFQVGLAYRSNQNPTEMFKWVRKAAEQGHVNAQLWLGMSYGHVGTEDQYNYPEAAKWYRMAAEQGSPEGQASLANYYEEGKGVPKDYAKAAEWYLKAAEQGYESAQYNIAVWYSEGRGLPENKTEAAKWYLKCAEQDDVLAQLAIAKIYAEGRGVKQDYVSAAKWFRIVAEKGNDPERNWNQISTEAQYRLGVLYAEGKGVPRDDIEAVKWYKTAAEYNHIEAQEALSNCYATGQGVPQDNGKALEWLQNAQIAREKSKMK